MRSNHPAGERSIKKKGWRREKGKPEIKVARRRTMGRANSSLSACVPGLIHLKIVFSIGGRNEHTQQTSEACRRTNKIPRGEKDKTGLLN